MKLQHILSGAFILALILCLSSCEEDPFYLNNNNNYNGSNLFTRYTLGGQTWVFTQYMTNNMTNPVATSDTLVFSDSTHYAWQGVSSTYHYYYFDGASYTQLLFDNSPFGGIIADVPDHFETYGQLNGAKFVFGFPSDNIYYYMWFKKV